MINEKLDKKILVLNKETLHNYLAKCFKENGLKKQLKCKAGIDRTVKFFTLNNFSDNISRRR